MKTVTVDDIMAQRQCEDYPQERVEALFAGRDSMNAVEIAGLPIPFVDALWVITICGILPNSLLRVFACDCAERVLHLYEKQHPGDNRPRRAIEVARAFAAGEATSSDLSAAEGAAVDAAVAAAGDVAAWDAVREAAREAAWAAARASAGVVVVDAARAAARAAARDAAVDAAWDAAWSAEREWQRKRLLQLIEEE